MKTTTRVMLAALLCTAAVACSKKVREEAPVDTGPSTGTVAPTAPTAPTAGAYGPNDLDSDACLRQRVRLRRRGQQSVHRRVILAQQGQQSGKAGRWVCSTTAAVAGRRTVARALRALRWHAMVAHFTPTPCSRMALAASTVI